MLCSIISSATWTQVGTKYTALGLVLLPMQLSKEFLTPKLGKWVDGNPMLSKSIYGYLLWGLFLSSICQGFLMLLLAGGGGAQP